jgi:periplasmic protein TonB
VIRRDGDIWMVDVRESPGFRDWKAPPCPIVVGSDSRLTLSISNSGASWVTHRSSPVGSMPAISQRMAVCVHRRETLLWAVLLSLALHLTLLVFLLLIIPQTEPQTSAADPLTVDVVVGEGAAGAASEQPAPTEATAEPVAPPSPPIEQAEIPPPTPAPEVPPPPVQQVELPPPTPEPAPDVPPPPPVQQTETPPPPPPIPTPKVPPPPRPVARVRPPVAPPQRVAAVAPVNPAAAVQAPAGPPAQAEGQNSGQSGASRGGGASTGATWTGKLKQWWDQHSFYPNEASRTNEGGNVRVRIVVAPDGQVISIQVVQGSGMSVLDAAALAVFRNARLPPFPPGTPAPPGDVVVTLHYRPADGGG